MYIRVHISCSMCTTHKMVLHRKFSEHNKLGVMRYSLTQAPPPKLYIPIRSSMCSSLSQVMVVPCRLYTWEYVTVHARTNQLSLKFILRYGLGGTDGRKCVSCTIGCSRYPSVYSAPLELQNAFAFLVAALWSWPCHSSLSRARCSFMRKYAENKRLYSNVYLTLVSHPLQGRS